MLLKSLYDSMPSSMQRMVDSKRFRFGMSTMFGSIINLKRNGFVPEMIIDVGAYEGRWSQGIKSIFPSAGVLMIEANPDKEQQLRIVQGKLGSGVCFESTLLGARPRENVTFYSMETGSSVMPEVTDVPRTPISLAMQTLDEVAFKHVKKEPLLLKLDVQGYELEVLRGGKNTLNLSEVLVLELSLLEYNKGAPLFAQVLAEVNEMGYALYDICGQHRRRVSGTLLQVDAIFVRKLSKLRI